MNINLITTLFVMQFH